MDVDRLMSIREFAAMSDVSVSTMKRSRRIVRAGLGDKVASGELSATEALWQANEILGIPNKPTSYQLLKARVAELEERNADLLAMALVYKELYEESR